MTNNSTVSVAANRRKTCCLEKFQPFYHIAAINNWKDIVLEQKEVIDRLQLKPICGFLGSEDDYEWTKKLGFNIEYKSSNILEYETPTLTMLYNWCQNNQKSAVLYFHTKGASVPDNDIKKYWRWLMTDFVIEDYKNNLKILEIADIVGVSWMDSKSHPHFSGNFWMARADWIIELQNPIDHKKAGGPSFGTNKQNKWDRMHAEMWIGSKKHHIVESLCCRNAELWKNSSNYDRYKQKGEK